MISQSYWLFNFNFFYCDEDVVHGYVSAICQRRTANVDNIPCNVDGRLFSYAWPRSACLKEFNNEFSVQV